MQEYFLVFILKLNTGLCQPEEMLKMHSLNDTTAKVKNPLNSRDEKSNRKI